MKTSKLKKQIVKSVFDKVHDEYDVMNDVMSLGSHRLWKKEFVKLMNVQKKEIILDMASGTGDITKIIAQDSNYTKIIRVDPNYLMLKKGANYFKGNKKISEICSAAEQVPLKSESIDIYAISFGIRNTFDTEKAIQEAYRLLKKGGKFICLEFYKVEKPILKELYKLYSKIIPSIGKLIVGDKEPYEYLTGSIQKFYTQDQFKEMLKQSKFKNVNYINLMGGIVSIHTAWKI